VTGIGGACPECLRRSLLVGRLAPRIAALLSKPPEERVQGVLGLEPGEMIRALVPADEREPVESWLDALDTDAFEEGLDESGIDALCVHHDTYPGTLAASPDPPPVLWALGGLDRLDEALAEPVVTIVGTRRPSPYGREIAYTLGRDLAHAGVTVVSGLALGIDAASHRGALDGRGAAVAVVANGPDIPYPRTNTQLWRRLAERGVVLSELPPGQRPFRWSFPARNRIMAAAAELTVVVEASKPSGSLITATFAEKLGRTIGAVPGRATSRAAAGSNELLRDGAALIRSAEDVIAELDPGSRERLRPNPPASAQVPTDLDSAAGRVLEAVEEEGSLEAIGHRARLAASEVRGALARLEGAGLVRRDPLGRYLRRAGA
jgi:DNA processing protein